MGARKKRFASGVESEPYEMVLDGKKVRVESAQLDLDSVRLDPRNPRIAHTIAVEAEPNVDIETLLEEYLWKETSVKELYRQVQANGGLVDPIIVRSDFTVAEGNCRTVVYRKLREKQPANAAWKRIPAWVLPAETDDRRVAMLLGGMHVAGKNTWSSFEKAGHVHDLHVVHGFTQGEVATQLRMSKSKVNQLVRAFDAMEKRYIPKYPGRGAVRKFSHFEELFKKPALRKWAEEPANLDLFVDWVGKDVVSKGAQVRDLPAIIRDRKAFSVLKKHGFEAAQEELALENPGVNSPLFRALSSATKALREARLDDIMKVRGASSSAAKQVVDELGSALGDFRKLCELE